MTNLLVIKSVRQDGALSSSHWQLKGVGEVVVTLTLVGEVGELVGVEEGHAVAERVVVDEAFGESHSLYQNGRAKSLQTAELGRWRWHQTGWRYQQLPARVSFSDKVLKFLKLAHHVTTKESTANYEIITLELPEDSDGARAVDDGMKHVSSDAHQIEIYHLI